MFLSDEDAKKFYDLWIPLLDFVNRKYKIKKNLYGMTSPRGLPLDEVAKISARLWENRSVIDEYIASVAEKMEDEDKAMISGWKHAVGGSFVVERHLNKGSVLISVEDAPRVYIVKGIYSSWREMLSMYPMPQAVRATLIPFKNCIIHDGIVSPYGVCMGKNMADEARQIYLAAKKNGKLIFNM